ncbi:MAG: 4-deoxy-4-formamido-L-arabinose-phosphoundecaprenol deformylase [Deltaproteobacteria bacterium]|nr:4-deoxy-4-formamido-L-arabinose-phosphoundecaprenol deformylase [Deltaproteobacteria bacterium]
MREQVAIRIDVDTRIGLKEGVPRLLELLRRHGLRASFFVSFGPDNSGRAWRRIVRPEFVLKMLRTNPLRLYGLRTLLSGTLLPAMPIADGEPEILRSIVAEGHELGIHGYDHVRWQDCLEKMREAEIEAELFQARKSYERILGVSPLSSAAPGWKCTPSSLAVQDRLRFQYASDVRGSQPFLPLHNGRPFKTLQIPTTLPTVDELLGRQSDINGFLLSALKNGLNVHTIHAEVEGRHYLSLLEDFLGRLRQRGVEVVTLEVVAESIRKGGLEKVPHLPVIRGRFPGRSGWVACQAA